MIEMRSTAMGYPGEGQLANKVIWPYEFSRRKLVDPAVYEELKLLILPQKCVKDAV